MKKKRRADSRESISTTWCTNEGLGVMKAMAYLGMLGKLAAKTRLAKGNPRQSRGSRRLPRTSVIERKACFSGLKNAMLVTMEPTETARLAREAEAKLAQGIAISRREQLALLARLLAAQETRQERRYGQA